MKATEANFLDFIKKSPQFVIPIYQRTYSWTERECRQLWDDILRAGAAENVSAHFIGSVVYIQDGLYQVTTQSPLLVIDGQQRLTTITLLIAALAEAIEALPEDQRETSYTIDDHPNLLQPKTRLLFDAFRREVLALDSCVTEEFWKYYVAYKAETNFVDVVPQASGLRLSLNMKWPDINDPRGICRDISSTKHWPNGDVGVKLTSLDELPYILGLVRQSLDLQMGSVGEA